MSKIKLNQDWRVPTGLSREARKLVFAIRKLAFGFAWSAGGQKVFWSPKEWAEKGEQYGKGAELVILHEGGDHAPFFSLDHASYDLNPYVDFEFTMAFLKKHGYWAEGLYTWSTAIYKNENNI